MLSSLGNIWKLFQRWGDIVLGLREEAAVSRTHRKYLHWARHRGPHHEPDLVMFAEFSLRLVCICFMPDFEKIVETKDRRLKLRDTVFMKCLFSLLPRPLVQVNHLGCILVKYF